ncbi:stage II sporulation protein M [Polymorphospora rubra]|uniref:stage II sporulation protein M n=1 Tax=Polymorphospora rubra TaxID=338584 RepID=UPI0033FB4155
MSATLGDVDLDAYVAEHEGEWRRLEQLSRGRRLSAAEADELVALYQRAATHLSVVRSRSPDPALVARLSRLVLTARAKVTGGSTFTWRDVGRFFTVGFPLAAYRAWPWWSGVAVAFSGLTAFIMWWVAGHPESAEAFVGEEAARELADSGFAAYYTEFTAPTFAFQLWTHNAWLAAQCLAAGILVVPTVWLLWVNALNIGAVGGVMIDHGRADVFFGLITPHGLLELTGVFVAAGVGLRIGWAWIAPPVDVGRGRALGEAARSGMLVALGLVGVFAVSGLIEAFVTPAPLPTVFRIGVGALVWGAFLVYVLHFGSRAAAAGESTDVSP